MPQTFVGNHDVTRIATTVGLDEAALALVVLMTVAGIPSIYYGDEVGMTGVKEERVGGDDAVRPALPESPAGLVDTQRLLDAHRALVALRRQHPWLTTARTEVLEISNTRLVYRSRAADDGADLVAEIDLDGTPSALVRDGDTVVWSFAA